MFIVYEYIHHPWMMKLAKSIIVNIRSRQLEASTELQNFNISLLSKIHNPEFEDPQAFIIFGLLVLINVLISCASSKLLFKFCKKLSSSDISSLVTKDGSRKDGVAAVQHEGQCLEPQSNPLHPCVRNSAVQQGQEVWYGA